MSEYINNIIYGIKSFITGMGLTLKHFRNKKDLVATLQYPNEKWPIPERNIGFDLNEYNQIRSRLHVDIDDCIGCLQCERACPVDCIKIDTIKPPKGNDYDCGKTSNDTQKKMIVPRFSIDMSECMYCNLCVYPCPEECIYMVGGPNEEKHEMDYEFSQYERHGLVYEFATATDQDILDIGGETYLEERKVKFENRAKGEKLEGVVASEEEVEAPQEGEEKKAHKDPLLEIFNIVPDKPARGIAKKAIVFGKRSKFSFDQMADEVSKRINDAGKSSDQLNIALDNLRKYQPAADESNQETTEAPSSSEPSTTDSKTTFSIKSIDFIQDKVVRGIAKKAFMAGKRANLEGAAMIDAVIKSLDEASKLDDETKAALNEMKGAPDSAQSDPEPIAVESTPETVVDFNIKSIDFIEDKVVRGIAKKAFMAGKRANLEGAAMIDAVIKALDEASKLDDNIKNTLEEMK